jgi:phenylpropionate dioxygenase-like ring-hydroxylating dioxygenase large terminal subunit
MDITDEVRRIIEEVRCSSGTGLTVDKAAVSMPPEAYTSEAFYAFEREAVFKQSWLYLCHESEVATPGSALPVTVAGEPLIVSRDMAGDLHVVSAVCQHRGYVIPCEPGGMRHLRCPYHSWTYALDGRLEGAPSMGPVHDLDELRATISLPSLRVEIWHGLVFAHFDPNADPLAPTLARLEPHVVGYRFEDLKVVDTVNFPDLPFNWKNMQENALEEYHTTYVHRGYHENAPANLVRHAEYAAGEGAVFRHAGLVQRAGLPLEGFPTFPVIPGLPEELEHHMLFLAVPPLNFAAVEAIGIKMFRIVPQSADRTTLTVTWLYPQETIDRPDFDELLKGQIALLDVIDQPDLDSNTAVYQGLRSQFAPRGPYSNYEATLPQLNHWLLERYERCLKLHEDPLEQKV